MSLPPVDVLVKEARDALRAAAGADLGELTEEELRELVVASHEVQKLAAAVTTTTMARFDTSRAWAGDGAQSAAHWAAWRCRLPMPAARATVACGRRLREMPATEAAFLGGELTPNHVRVLAEAQAKNAKAFAADEEELLSFARDLLFRAFVATLRRWCDANDPDDAEGDARGRYEAREVHCSTTFQGTVRLDGNLEPVGGAIVKGELERLEQRLFEADWAEARARLGDAATVRDLARTPKQRRADALTEMARRSAGADGTGPRPLLTVLVGEATLARICELSTGTVLTPGEVLPLLTDADIERVVFDGPSRVLDVGVRRRFFTGATRRAVEVRDRGCAHASCEVAAEQCEVDHVVPYEAGGETVQANGECRCPFHHRWRHRNDPRPRSAVAA